MKSVKNLSLGGTHVIGCKGVRHLIGCRRPLVEKTHLWIGVALDESQKSAHKCREVYKLKALRQMRVWLFIYQCNNFQICIWWKLQITDDLYICEFLLHIFKTRNICVRITNMFTNLIFICEFFFLLIYGLKHICVCIENAFVYRVIYIYNSPNTFVSPFSCIYSFLCAFIHYETVLAP